MSKKVKIISLSLGIIAVLSVGAVSAIQVAQKEKELADCIKARTSFELGRKLPSNKEDASTTAQRIQEEKENCRKSVYMTGEEKAKIVAEKKQMEQESLRLQEEQKLQGLLEPEPIQRLPAERLGIGGGSEMVMTAYKGFAFTNSWMGYLDASNLTSIVQVTAGYQKTDPMQG
ncbi:MAG: hypothetical protein ACREA4_09960, partial [Nitrososphaera sp.]